MILLHHAIENAREMMLISRFVFHITNNASLISTDIRRYFRLKSSYRSEHTQTFTHIHPLAHIFSDNLLANCVNTILNRWKNWILLWLENGDTFVVCIVVRADKNGSSLNFHRTNRFVPLKRRSAHSYTNTRTHSNTHILYTITLSLTRSFAISH